MYLYLFVLLDAPKDKNARSARRYKMLDITKETPISLTEATKILPPIDGRRLHVSSVWRWARKGIGGITLEYVRVGGRVCTSAEAISRFVNALAALDGVPAARTPVPQSPATRKRSASQRAKDIQRAEGELAKAGI